jgi:large subunit ribosomal protein L22
MKAILRAARITPKKANLIAGMVRKRPTSEALDILKYTPKKAAQLIHKLLSSAVANAVTNFKQDESTLVIKEIVVNKGPTLKRGVPVSRGRVYPILKRTANITILLEVSEAAAKDTKKTAKKSSDAAETEKTEKPAKKAPKAKKSSK